MKQEIDTDLKSGSHGTTTKDVFLSLLCAIFTQIVKFPLHTGTFEQHFLLLHYSSTPGVVKVLREEKFELL